MGFKDFIEKAKEKSERMAYERKEKEAHKKGFSNYNVYQMQTAIARKEGYEAAKSKLRKNELRRVKQEAYNEGLDTRPGYVKKFEKGKSAFNKGIKEYNSIMSELQGAGSMFNSGQNSNQAYASGYGPYKPRKQKEPRNFADMMGFQTSMKRRKKSKPKKMKYRKRSTNNPKSIYDYASRY